jgi:hypothetical protein
MIRVDKGFRCVKRQDERWGFLEGQKLAEAATLAATFHHDHDGAVSDSSAEGCEPLTGLLSHRLRPSREIVRLPGACHAARRRAVTRWRVTAQARLVASSARVCKGVERNEVFRLNIRNFETSRVVVFLVQ